jgi:SIR2-like domain
MPDVLPILDDVFTKAGLSGDYLDQLADGVARGRYHLLLGAGASVGGFGGDARPLPAGDRLRDELIGDFLLPAKPAELTLPQAYTAAGRRNTPSGLTLSAYLRHRFSNCTPPEWLLRIPTLNWKRIWTLNIDDTLEMAYRSANPKRQQLMPVEWNDDYRDPPGNHIHAVHLHGRAGSDNPSLVFSALDYQDATATRRTYHLIFGGQFTEDPFIVIGARMADEVDLIHFLRRGSTSRASGSGPSVAVLLNVHPLLREELEAAGLIVLDMTAADFISSLEPHVRAAERKLAGIALPGLADLSQEARTFLNQFTALETSARPLARRKEFYDGWEPTWFDILEEKDAVFHETREILARIDTARTAKEPQQVVQLLTGRWATGKTTTLYRVAREVLRRGMAAFYFRGEQAMDISAVLWWISRSPNSVLFFEGMADFATDVDRLAREAENHGIPMYVVGVERSTRLRTTTNEFRPSVLAPEAVYRIDRLSRDDVDSLLAKLAERHRLGSLAGVSPEGRKQHFRRANGHLFTALARLTEGPGFIQRVPDELRSQRLSEGELAVLAAVALAHEFGYPLPIALAVATSGMPALELVRSVEEGKLSTWLSLNPNGLRLPHRHVATLILEEGFTGEQRYRYSLALGIELGNRMNPDSFSNRTVEYRIARNVLDFRMARRWAGRSLLNWYSDLEASNSWNARYWEQRAIAHFNYTTRDNPDGDLSSARAYAENAVALLPRDAYVLTTLGNVVLRQAVVAAKSSDGRWAELYELGVRNLRQAERLRRERTTHAYSIVFTQSFRVVDELRRHGLPPEEIRDELQWWLTSARRGDRFVWPRQREELAEWQRRFLLAFAVDPQSGE